MDKTNLYGCLYVPTLNSGNSTTTLYGEYFAQQTQSFLAKYAVYNADSGASIYNSGPTTLQGQVTLGVPPVVSQSQPSNPAGPGSTVAITMQGLAASITPKFSGNVCFIVSATVATTIGTAGDGIAYQISYGTGVAPTNGTAETGTQIGNTQIVKAATAVTPADFFEPVSIQACVSGLAVGTSYWFDLAAVAQSATGYKFINPSMSAIES